VHRAIELAATKTKNPSRNILVSHLFCEHVA
jgi:hypothetical protein